MSLLFSPIREFFKKGDVILLALCLAASTFGLFHFDMYRLGSSDELFDIGWEDYLARGGVCAVEWSENVAGALEEGAILVDICRGALDGPPFTENFQVLKHYSTDRVCVSSKM